MTTITPRWEWRTFGDDFGDIDEHIESLGATGTQETDELYFLSPDGENVKVRDDLLDIKVLREVDATGLERWEPVLKAGFPLAAEQVRQAFDALRQPAPALARDSYTLDQLLSEVVEPAPDVRAVPVHKRRVRYTIHGCMGELSDVTAGGRTTRTIAIETEDAAAVRAAVTNVGLGERLNVSFPVGLTLLVDDAPPRYAVVDCGTNSVKFLVGERADDGSWSPVVDRAEITRLGEGMGQGGAITAEAIDRTRTAIKGMAQEARQVHARALAAVGTAGLRMATNRDDVVRAVEEATGVHIDVISGDEESRLAYQAVRAGLGPVDGSIVVFDTGGGSTQLTFGEGAEVRERFSVDVGAVRFTDQFGLDKEVSQEVLHQALDAIAADLARLDGRPRPDVLVGMGGAVTNLMAVKLALDPYDPDRVQGAVLERTDVEAQIERYRSTDADGRRSIVGLQPKRAEVILAGACVVLTVMDKLGQDRLTVSDRGLRHGVLAERFADAAD
jgi:exopolyphosphatase / guanosine-5'-triphosphate,3'-diphosphate pyrophosphatase